MSSPPPIFTLSPNFTLLFLLPHSYFQLFFFFQLSLILILPHFPSLESSNSFLHRPNTSFHALLVMFCHHSSPPHHHNHYLHHHPSFPPPLHLYHSLTSFSISPSHHHPRHPSSPLPPSPVPSSTFLAVSLTNLTSLIPHGRRWVPGPPPADAKPRPGNTQ